MAPPPPPPPPGPGLAPAPPPPPGGPRGPSPAFKIVPGLGDALHEAMRKISGVEEIEPAAEGIASDSNRHTSTPTGPNRPNSWHGAQVPGKPKISRPLMSEMEGRLAKRRDKVDKESYVVEGPDPVVVPEPVCLPPSGARKPSTTSIDSGRGISVEPGQQRRNSLEPNGYTRVSVDRERKEELKMAKAVRQSSAKILGRASPIVFSGSPRASPVTIRASPVTIRAEQTPPPQTNLSSPSPVVMRYWNQFCSTADSGYFGDEGIDTGEVTRDSNGDVIPPWKLDAIEGDETQFPSIASKIKQMEEEVNRPLVMYEVPDVKSKMRTGAPAAKWMEARGKLQNQLDNLISKTSEKMAKYGTVHAREKAEFTKDASSENKFFDGDGRAVKSSSPQEAVDNKVKTLIKTVANEIQKSFSMKSIHTLDDEEDECMDKEVDAEESKEEIKEETKIEDDKKREKNAKKMIQEVKRRQKHIDVEAPILDFELKEPTPDPEPEEAEQEDENPVDLQSPPGALNFSAAKSKLDIRRKTSKERRLPAGVLAKRNASEMAKAAPKITTNDASTSTESAFTEIELAVAEKLKRKELFSDKVLQTQWEISNAEYELSKLSDNEKADLLTKQIAKMKSSHVNKLLKSIDTGVLDISLPLLIPFLSLQARMSLGVHLFRNKFNSSNAEDKNKMAKETFLDTMIKDITDIALLQEVIERSHEKILLLSAEDEKRFAQMVRQKKLINIEDDSYDLGPLKSRSSTPLLVNSPRRSATPNVREASPLQIPLTHETVPRNSPEKIAIPTAKIEQETENITKREESADISDEVIDTLDNGKEEAIDTSRESVIVLSDEKKTDDEGCPTSESDEDKEEGKTNHQKDEESDEGLGKSDDNSAKVEEEELSKEKQIKKKILDILQDAKAMDQKRNIRNFGRTFEFQGVKEQLRPVLPNDKRPQKAKRLDTLWMQVTNTKQGYQSTNAPSLEEIKARRNTTKTTVPTLEELKARKNTAKATVPSLEEVKNKQGNTGSSVPWTKKGNVQPVNKEVLAAQKEVEEFESCRKTLQDNAKHEANTNQNAGKVQTVKKDEIVNICKTTINEETKEKVVIESKKDEPKHIICEKVEIEKTDAKEVNMAQEAKKEVVNIVSSKEFVNSICITKTEIADAKVEKVEVKDIEESISKVKEVSHLKETSEINWTSMSDSSDSETSSEVEWEVSGDEKEETVKAKKDKSPELKDKTLEIKEKTPEIKEKTPEINEKTSEKKNIKEKSPTKPVIPPKPVIPSKEIPSLLFSPAVRRRGEMFGSSTVTVSASIRLPPPPSFKPPPPPVSPPVPASKVKDLEKIYGKILDIEVDETSSEEEEEEVSDWDYETDSEED